MKPTHHLVLIGLAILIVLSALTKHRARGDERHRDERRGMLTALEERFAEADGLYPAPQPCIFSPATGPFFNQLQCYWMTEGQLRLCNQCCDDKYGDEGSECVACWNACISKCGNQAEATPDYCENWNE